MEPCELLNDDNILEVINVDSGIFLFFFTKTFLEKEKFQEMYSKMADNPEQKAVVDAVIEALNNGTVESKCFYLDGPGGTGKTFVYKTLTHLFKSLKKSVKNCASTGIAGTFTFLISVKKAEI